MSSNDVDKVYTGIVADIAKLAQTLAKTETYGSANGPDALLAFADHLAGIVAAVGVNPFGTVGDSVRNKQVRY
ncbi:MAG: hypothetical protein EOP64_07575 [Sphingomonas sp.]|nr:MAG: hypothetical protein EOP64_07575 [Sphingomonas sp.]